jgi:hypothetical protein
MAGFWNALSVLAPVAPALSDAQDIRAQRQADAQRLAQQAAAFPKEQALRDAQITAERLAAQSEQQRLTQGAQPTIIGEPQWNPATHSNQVLTFDRNTGALALRDAPGIDPSAAASAKYAAAKSDYKKIAGRDLSPEEDESLFFQAYGYKPTASRISQLTGDAGKPYKGNDGQYYVNAKDATGAIIQMPLGPNYQPPAPKPATSPSAIFANLLTKQILASKRQGPPLSAQESAQLVATRAALDEAGVARANAMAQANAANHLYLVTDPNTGMETAIPVAAGIAAYNQGTPFLAGAVSAPTGSDKKNSILAQSAIQQVNRMQSILKADPKLTGPGSGQLTRLQMWLGTQDPDAQQFLISSLLASEHGVAVFGGRNIHTISDLQNALGSMKTNPAALSAALDVVKETMAPFATAGGRLPAPGTGGAGAGGAGGTGSTTPPKNTVTLKAGGKVYNIPRDRVAAFRKDHPDATQ